MALMKSALITDISGSIGGMTFFRSKAGIAIRSRVVPVNPSTALQIVVRNALSAAAVAWKDTLTAAERANWGAYATATPVPGKLGGTTNIGGEAMFVRSQVPRLQAGLAMVTAAPTTSGVGDIPGIQNFVMTAGNPGNGNIDFFSGVSSDWTNNAGAALLLYGSAPFSVGRSYFKGPYRLAGIILGNVATPPTSPAVITWPYNVGLGQQVGLQARVTRADGRLTSALRFRDST